jgi:hypothetical protein
MDLIQSTMLEAMPHTDPGRMSGRSEVFPCVKLFFGVLAHLARSHYLVIVKCAPDRQQSRKTSTSIARDAWSIKKSADCILRLRFSGLISRPTLPRKQLAAHFVNVIGGCPHRTDADTMRGPITPPLTIGRLIKWSIFDSEKLIF